MELVKRKFNLESSDTLQQSVADFNNFMIHELVKNNFLSFSPRDIAIFCIYVCAMLKNTWEPKNRNNMPCGDDLLTEAENMCKNMFGVNLEDETVRVKIFEWNF